MISIEHYSDSEGCHGDWFTKAARANRHSEHFKDRTLVNFARILIFRFGESERVASSVNPTVGFNRQVVSNEDPDSNHEILEVYAS